MATQFNFKYYLVFIGFMLSFLYTLSAFGQDTGVTLSPAEGTGAVNVRSGPGTEYTIRFSLNEGQSLVATGRNDFAEGFACSNDRVRNLEAWLRVMVSETIEGWVNLCAVEVEGDVQTLTVAEPSYSQLIADVEPLEDLAGGGEAENAALLTTTNTEVVLRSEPWLGGEAYGVVPGNAEVEMVQMTTNTGWVQVRYGEYTGWIPGFSVGVTEDQQETVPVVANSRVVHGSHETDEGLSGLCLWFPGLRQPIDPFTGVSVPIVVPNAWYLCY